MARSFNELKEKMSPERRERVEERARGFLIGLALQELRQARHFTQQELAEILDINGSLGIRGVSEKFDAN